MHNTHHGHHHHGGGGIGPGAAVGLGLGALALGTALGAGACILTGITPRCQPITHRPPIPIRGAAGIRNTAAISPAEVGRPVSSLPFAPRAAPLALLQPLAGPRGRTAHSRQNTLSVKSCSAPAGRRRPAPALRAALPRPDRPLRRDLAVAEGAEAVRRWFSRPRERWARYTALRWRSAVALWHPRRHGPIAPCQRSGSCRDRRTAGIFHIGDIMRQRALLPARLTIIWPELSNGMPDNALSLPQVA